MYMHCSMHVTGKQTNVPNQWNLLLIKFTMVIKGSFEKTLKLITPNVHALYSSIGQKKFKYSSAIAFSSFATLRYLKARVNEIT